jgi:hypothetical protein
MIDNTYMEQLFDLVAAKRHADSVATGLPDIGVTDDEKEQVRSWADGGELKHLVNQPGYEILMGKLARYMDRAVGEVRDSLPGSPEASNAQCVLYCAHRILSQLLAEVKRDIESSETVPEIVKEGAKIAKGVPPPGM